MREPNKVVFACVHNAGRSQIAAAFFNQLADPAVAHAMSGGTDPGPRVHPQVVAAMKEVGVDLSRARPRLLTDEVGYRAKLLVTMGEDALAFVNELDFPLSAELETTEGGLQRFTPTIDALFTPDVDASLDEQPAKTRFWNAFKPLGAWWAELPPY